MLKDRHTTVAGRRTGLLLALLLFATGASAQSADELFADGNRLARDQLYWAALLRYEQAADAGLDTPLLHYNTGVAHYRAKQYTRARQAFLCAAAEPSLVHVARYNLGLTAMASGDRDAAVDWFRQVEAQTAKPQLAALSTRALQRLQRLEQGLPEGDGAPVLAPLPRNSGLSLRALVGVGSDDNAYRSPDEAYNDRTQAGAPLVTPEVQSGVYYPVDVTAKYSVYSFDHESFFGSYRLAGRYYQDPLLSNANELSHELAFGTEYRRRTENRERRIFSAFRIAQHDETWFDPDDGTERSIDGETVGDRLSYRRYGPEIWARQSFSRLSFNAYGKGQIWNYENTGSDLPEFDHEFLKGGMSVQYRFTSTSLLRLEGEVFQRRFGDRRSYELDGTQNINSPVLRYDYVNYGAVARQRITRAFWFGVKYQHTTRSDKHLGYNDYLRDSYGVDLSLRISDRFRLQAGGWYRLYNYVNAFAYHEPGAGRKTLEAVNARLTARWQLTNNLSLVGNYEYRDTASNDRRIDYTRGRFMLGIRWQQ
jgi:hypothetical protein